MRKLRTFIDEIKGKRRNVYMYMYSRRRGDDVVIQERESKQKEERLFYI